MRISNCCSAPLLPESDVCSACKEHAEPVPLAECVLDGNRGIYIPQIFAEMCHSLPMSDELKESFEVCRQGPDNPDYWDAWSEILDNFSVTEYRIKYRFFQDGDLFREEIID